MGGFKNEASNLLFKRGFAYAQIIPHLIECCKLMKAESIAENNPLKNHEDRISDRLVANYLNAMPNAPFRFRGQSQVNFDKETDSFVGRIDFEVITSDIFRNDEVYHVIECKRIDGSYKYNKKYVVEGVERFFSVPMPKYPSYNGRSTMIGYVVKDIDIPANATKIDVLQQQLLPLVFVGNFKQTQTDNSQYCVYACEYKSDHTGLIELTHLFFNFADAIG